MAKYHMRSCPLLLSLLSILFYSSIVLAAPVTTYSVVSLGAKADGKTDSTQAFISAWTKACASVNPAVIYVPAGRFDLGKVVFNGPCKNSAIGIRIDGTLVAPSDYSVLGNEGNWLLFEHVDGVTISGGILDGQGTGLWDCKSSGKSCPSGATTLEFSNSKNIVVSRLTSLNSQMFHIVVNGCQNVKMQGVEVTASGDSPNTDGIHVQLSSDVTILSSKIRTGDDCISIGPGATNLWIENVACGPGHGISIGSLGKDLQEVGVQNVTVKTVTFTGTQNGVRIKTWGRPSNGFARNILFQHAIMVDVQNPILIDQNYCPDNKGCPGQVSGVKISDVTYQDIHGTSATEVAVKFDCSSKNPCSRIRLEDVKLTYKNQAAQVSCTHAAGTSSGAVQPSGCL
ncbi:polygalacturonase-like [Juglans microcarpa x Juglans regia]|uniref:polygalacturonase-like n=1 Tax=Juglans microcarpa x Juglans regia TaxID=2249226 RepID=UPI001B7F1397|nr:polygalacturonase-like [Juglans microcarpa x Juglans regia]